MTSIREWIAALPDDAVMCVVNAWRDGYDDQLGDQRAGCVAFRKALMSLAPHD